MNDFNIIHRQEVNIDGKSDLSSWDKITAVTEAKPAKSLETLIQINEISNEKLKISLRRLSLAESEIQQLKEKLEETHSINQNLQEQIFIFKEKDKASKATIGELQERNEIIKIQLDMLTQREHELKNEVSRLKKYQDKINTQVKPYFKQLKEYSRNLEQQTVKISELNEHKEVQIKELKEQIGNVIRNFQIQSDLIAQKNEKTLLHYEEEIAKFQEELKKIQEHNSSLISRNEDLEHYHQKYLETENKLIEIERYAQDRKSALELTISTHEDKIKQLSRHEFKLETEIADLKLTTKTLIAENTDLKQKLMDTEKQLESMKYLWDQKNNENSKLKSSLESLERINVELSRSLTLKNKA